MRPHVRWAALAVLLPAAAVAAVSCNPVSYGPPAPLADRPTPTFTTEWTQAQRDSFYHLSEGSEVVPTFLVRALWNPVTNRPIMADPERFGLIFDPNSPDSLPVGVTSDETVDTRLLGVKMLGLNCSACHVAQIRYQGKVLQVDGAPAHFNPDTLSAELGAAMAWTVSSPRNIIQFLERARHYARSPQEARLLTLGGGTLQEGAAVYARLQPDVPPPAGDTAHANFVERLHDLLETEAAKPGMDHGQGLGGNENEPADRMLRARYHALADSLAIARVTGTRPNAVDALARKIGADERRAEAALHDYVEDLVVAVRLLNDRLATLKKFFPGSHGQPAGLKFGPGRVDAFDVARNMIYVNDPVPVNAPVSFPWLWGFTRNVWLHYDANTNSVMERNMGQALGVGAVFDRHTAESTLNPVNLHALEILSRGIQPPRWPVEMFGALDPAKVSRGEAVFNRECARCHFNGSQQIPFDSVYEPWYIGTDSTRIVNFATPVSDTSLIAGRPSPKLSPAPSFTDVVGPLLHKIREQAYAQHRVSPQEQAVMNGCANDSVWRTTRAWQSRPLSGIWATAPYLHNGSVPTLHDLLRPAAERPDSFIVGNPEYDPVKVGYVSAVAPGRGTFVFRTNQVGNGNGGHEFGTRMSESDRMALLEYLKDHTLPMDTTFACPGGTGTRPPGRVPPRQTR